MRINPIFTALIIGLFPLFSSAIGGNGVGNGGDVVALQFIQLARQGVICLETFQQTNPLSAKHSNYLKQIRIAIDTVPVETKEVLRLDDGREVDAINYPEVMKIEVSRSRWHFLQGENLKTQIMLVFHEYLGVTGFDDHNYQESISLLENITPEFTKQQELESSHFTPVLSITNLGEGYFRISALSSRLDVSYFECSINQGPFRKCQEVEEVLSSLKDRIFVMARFVTLDGRKSNVAIGMGMKLDSTSLDPIFVEPTYGGIH